MHTTDIYAGTLAERDMLYFCRCRLVVLGVVWRARASPLDLHLVCGTLVRGGEGYKATLESSKGKQHRIYLYCDPVNNMFWVLQCKGQGLWRSESGKTIALVATVCMFWQVQVRENAKLDEISS